jgi:hypothetical protein
MEEVQHVERTELQMQRNLGRKNEKKRQFEGFILKWESKKNYVVLDCIELAQNRIQVCDFFQCGKEALNFI